MILDDTLNICKMFTALHGPRRTEDEIRKGQGRIATAYKHADKLGDPAPVVSTMPGVYRLTATWFGGRVRRRS